MPLLPRPLLAAAALAGLLLSPLTTLAQAPAPIKVGVIGPFTGPSSDFGQPMLNGVRLAVEEINAVGGYMVTDRMLASFKKKEKRRPREEAATGNHVLKAPASLSRNGQIRDHT